jgi:metallo-beta-lactamase class B
MTHRILITAAILLSSLSGTYAQENKLSISHLTGDFYVFTTYNTFNGNSFPANGMYLVTTKGVVIIDTPWDTTQFQPLLDSIKIKHHKNVVMCIATHSHEDRTGGLEFMKHKGIKTYTSRQTDNISKERGEKRAEFLLDKDTVFKIGNHSFQTYYPGQAHTPDNIVIWFNKEKILYGGCLVKSTEANNLGNLADANVKEWKTTINNIQGRFKKPNYIIPGHQAWSSNKSLEHTLRLILESQK